MGIRFRKSIKLGSLVKLNISKSGLSATVGKGGASVNIGSKGVYANVNPSIAGIKGTGISYRKKLLSNPFCTKTSIKNNETKETIKEANSNNYDEIINIHKIADNVLSKDDFNNLKDIDSLDLLIKGDEDIIENRIGIFLDNIDLPYPVKANYELEDNVLLVDLDLPEIEIFKSNGIVLSKEDYAKAILNLSLYLCINFFNISSYIDEIVLSGFISKRNKDGDLVDEYLYSVKYIRDIFEKTDFASLDKTYDFILQFENRINLNESYSFKSIKPYTLINDSMIDDIVTGLERLGFKKSDIYSIMPEISKLRLNSTSDYIKEALTLLNR